MATVYKCPNCFMGLRFDAATGKLVCDYCDSTFTVEEVEQAEKMKQTSDEKAEYIEKGDEMVAAEEMTAEDEMAVYTQVCPNCGATIMGDKETAATFCSFCGNPTLNEAVFSKEKKPSRVIPFKQTTEQAQKAYKDWASKGFLTPKDFCSTSTIEKVTGIYVPFWLYDCDARCDYYAEATKVSTRKVAKQNTIETIEITEHYDVHRLVECTYNKVPVDASEKMDDAIMDLLEPYDYKGLVDFKMPYLSGFFAEKYGYEAEELKGRVSDRISSYVEQAARDTITGYDGVSKKDSRQMADWKGVEYVMLPVWLLNYKYKGEDYTFAMNGQTGRIVGKRPIDQGKKNRLFFTTFLITFIVCLIIGLILFT